MPDSCKQCGAALTDRDAFCTKCGAQREASSKAAAAQQFCRRCGAALASSTKFCTKCGSEIIAGARAAAGNTAQNTHSPQTSGRIPKGAIIGTLAIVAVLILGG